MRYNYLVSQGQVMPVQTSVKTRTQASIQTEVNNNAAMFSKFIVSTSTSLDCHTWVPANDTRDWSAVAWIKTGLKIN